MIEGRNSRQCRREKNVLRISPNVTNTGKVKVKFSLCLTNEALHHEDVWVSGYIIHVLLTTALFSDQIHTLVAVLWGIEPPLPIRQEAQDIYNLLLMD
jgi:hypothetical protein